MAAQLFCWTGQFIGHGVFEVNDLIPLLKSMIHGLCISIML